MSEPSSPPRIIVTGATSLIGRFLLPRLLTAGYEVHAVSRAGGKHPGTTSPLIWHQADIAQADALPAMNAQALIHLAPLWLLPPLLPALALLHVRRVIGFSSTSVFSKADSRNEMERRLAERLAGAEEMTSRLCETRNMRWTVFRPTLVYDCHHDRNITRIADFIRRYGFFPLLGKAAGQRQPVHADDLANASVLALWKHAAFDKAYNLSGGETLTYCHMVKRIFQSLGQPVRFLTIPAWLFRGAIRGANLLPFMRGVTPEMAMRMNTDLCFDHTEATRDFDFSPRRFSPRWETGLEVITDQGLL